METYEGRDCAKCGVYNPAGRDICWRCDEPLPIPKSKKKKRRLSSQHWLYIMMAVFVVVSLVQLCGAPRNTEALPEMISPSVLLSYLRLGLGM